MSNMPTALDVGRAIVASAIVCSGGARPLASLGPLCERILTGRVEMFARGYAFKLLRREFPDLSLCACARLVGVARNPKASSHRFEHGPFPKCYTAARERAVAVQYARLVKARSGAHRDTPASSDSRRPAQARAARVAFIPPDLKTDRRPFTNKRALQDMLTEAARNTAAMQHEGN